MDDQLDDDLENWGKTPTPRVDGAFANRLEASLRTQMLDDGGRTTRGWSSFVFRPAFVVLAIAAVVVGLAFIPRGDDEVGLAEGDESTTTTTVVPTTSADPRDLDPPVTTLASVPPATDVAPSTETTEPDPLTTTQPPETTEAPSSTETDRTTVPATTVPATIAPSTTIPADSAVALEVLRDGRRVTATWTVRGDIDTVVGWVLIATVDGDGDLVASSRDRTIRTLSVQVSDLSQTFRIEGRDSEGSTIVSSDEVSLSRDG